MYFYVYLICTKNNNNSLTSYVGYTNNLKKELIFTIHQKEQSLLEEENGR